MGLGVFLLLLGLWLANTSSRPELLNRDWVAFDNAGWRGLGGNWASVYTSSTDERWAYLYPPVAIVLSSSGAASAAATNPATTSGVAGNTSMPPTTLGTSWSR